MSLARIPLRVHNNTDWDRSFIFLSGPGAVTPWEKVASWKPGTTYSSSPASVVVQGGDLHVARPTAPTTWVSGAAFESAYWFKVAAAAGYNGVPYDLTGAVLRMAIDFGSGGKLVLSTENGFLTIPDPPNGVWGFAFPAARAAAVKPGSYPYDMILIQGAKRRIALAGTITVEAGETP